MITLDQSIIDLIQLSVLLGGVLWGIYRFGAEAPHKPRVEFSVNAKFLAPTDTHYATEFIVTAENKGLRTQTFDQITLTVRGIDNGTTLEEWKGREPRLFMPIKIIDKAELVYKNKYGSIFVEPTVSQDITYFARIPTNISIISVRAEFKYGFGKTHSSERLIEVKSENA